MGKEKCSCDGLMLASLLIGVALGAVIMIAIGAIIVYDSEGVPLIFGAKWWEVFTAFGTVGAVLVALVFGLKAEIDKALTKKHRNQLIKTKINDKISAYLGNFEWVVEVATGRKDLDRVAMVKLTRLWWIEAITDKDILELASLYPDAYKVVQARERMLYFLKIGNVPRKIRKKDISYYPNLFHHIGGEDQISGLMDIWTILRGAVVATAT